MCQNEFNDNFVLAETRVSGSEFKLIFLLWQKTTKARALKLHYYYTYSLVWVYA